MKRAANRRRFFGDRLELGDDCRVFFDAGKIEYRFPVLDGYRAQFVLAVHGKRFNALASVRFYLEFSRAIVDNVFFSIGFDYRAAVCSRRIIVSDKPVTVEAIVHRSVDVIVSEQVVTCDRAPVSAGSRFVAVGRDKYGIDTYRLRRTVEKQVLVRHKALDRVTVTGLVVYVTVLCRRRERRVMILYFVLRPTVARKRRSVLLYAVTAHRHKVDFVLKHGLYLIDVHGEVHFYTTVHIRAARDGVLYTYAVVHVVGKVHALFAESRGHAHFAGFARHVLVDCEPAISRPDIIVEFTVERYVRVGVGLYGRLGIIVRRRGIVLLTATRDYARKRYRQHKHKPCDFQNFFHFPHFAFPSYLPRILISEIPTEV